MRPISIEGFEKPESVAAGAVPMLQWMKIADLVVDPAYQRPIAGKGRLNVDQIARSFSWSCFSPVVVSPVEGGQVRDHRRPAPHDGCGHPRHRMRALPDRHCRPGRAGCRLQGNQCHHHPEFPKWPSMRLL
jgi:hypothetical protein